ncbi:hypothetical protein ACIBI3_05650 [Actinomadura luteofluorescens]|uniref:hypothetical protein n=1 Tax=Actinomadura luteofluorescens TaxID=46163 RepID=UPI00347E0EA3
MSTDYIVAALTFVVVLVSMLITHNVADHWVQTQAQARDKGLQGAHMWKGRLACLRHVASYTACTGTGAYALDQAWHWWWIFIASVVTAVAV